LVNEFPADEAPIIFELDLNYTETPTRVEKVEVPQRQPLPTAMPTANGSSETKKTQNNQSGFLVRPSVIYSSSEVPATAKPNLEENTQIPPVAETKVEKTADTESNDAMQLVFKEEPKEITPSFQPSVFEQPSTNLNGSFDEAEAQKAKADERLYKLRNLSYNFNSADPNNEYENTPAYVRHNWQINNPNFASVEKFYSSYAVGTDDNNVAQLSTINTFLEGKKPD
jgi:cell division protein FtsZ